MDINPKHLDAALNVLGVTMNIPLNTLVFNLHNALDAAANDAAQAAYQSGYNTGYSDAENDAENEADFEAFFHEREVQQVAKEQYEDGYIDAVHDFQTCPVAALEHRDSIEEARELAYAALAMDPTISS